MAYGVWVFLFGVIVAFAGATNQELPKESGAVARKNLNLTPEEKAYLAKHSVLRVHNESNWPPFNFSENGIPRGFSVDYMKLLAQRLGVGLQFVSGYTWEEFMRMLPTSKLDVIINIAPTQERSRAIDFTQPYISVRNAIYTNINNQFFYTLKDLKGKKVALPKGFFIQRFLKQHYPEIRQILVKDQLEALQLLSFGKVDAVIGKQVVVDYLLRENLLSNIVATTYVKDPRTLSLIALGVSKEDAVLARILDKAQKAIDSKEMEELRHHWFGINALLDTSVLLTPKERSYLGEKKIINVCIEPDRAPVEFLEQGKASGIAIDTLRILAKRLDLDLHFVATQSWEQTEELLRKRRCDLLPALLQNRINKRYLLFTRPYFTYETVVVSREKIEKVRDLSRFRGRKMATRWNSPLTERIKKSHPDIRILEFGTYEEAFEAVEGGMADFVLTTRPIFAYYRKRLKLRSLHIAGTVPIRSDLSIAVRKDELILFDIVKKMLDALPRETFHAINDRWTRAAVIRHVDYRLLAKYLGVALLVILLLFAAYLRQRRLSIRIEELNKTLEFRVEEALEENRRQEMRMVHRDRLANLGEMISMIAHQWRQPLNNLSLLNQLLITKYKKGQLDEEAIDYFRSNSQRQIQQMSRTIDDFRNFYKPQKEKKRFCVEESIRQLIELIGVSFKEERIDIELEAAGTHELVGYPNELAHAILNILNNAKDAFVERGSSARKIRIEVFQEHQQLIVRVCDNAGGIPAEHLQRIFDPYFSTKNAKNGTGMGLYISNVIITEHFHGHIDVENHDEGACFTIRLNFPIL